MPITKHNYLVKDVKDLAKTIHEAFHLARTGRPGPVLIDIPKDVTTNMAVYNPKKDVDMPTYKPTVKGHSKQINVALSLIKKSKRPIILAGGGVIAASAAEELREFVGKTSLPITSTLMALGVISDDEELSLKFPGMHGAAYANLAIYEADLLIAVGMRFDDRITGKISEFGKNAKVIHIDVDPAEIGKSIPVDVPIVGDAKQILHAFNKNMETPLEQKTEWLDRIKSLKAEYPLTYDKNDKFIVPQQVIEEVSNQIKDDAIISTDVGEHQMWSAQYIKHYNPRHFVTSGGLGTMGFGLPAAMGVQVANPNSTSIVFSGDGSIQMNIQELSTIANYNLPVKVMLLNNGYLGMVRQWQELFYDKRYSHTDLEGKQPDFMKLADAYGILGIRVEKPEEVKGAIEKALAHDGPVFVEFVVNREENVFPFVPAGGVLNKMMFKGLEG
jgi:acetolactate synthase I/II/III large subunit